MKVLVELASKAREASGVRIYKRNVEAVLSAVLKSGDFWEIVDMSSLPVTAASGIVKVLIDEGILFIDDEENIKLTQKGFDFVRELGIETFEDHL
ncbi:MAG: putative methyltransferase, partial [Thermocrinis sp.]